MEKPEISEYIKNDPSELSNAEILIGYQKYSKALWKYADHLESKLKPIESSSGVIWRCDEGVFRGEDGEKVFTKGVEYKQIQTGFIWVIDDEGHKHDIKKYKFTSI